MFVSEKRTGRDRVSLNITREYLPQNTVKSHMADIKQKRDISVSENDVITAMLWKKYIPAWRKKHNDQNVYITLPFDFRRVLTGFPKNYFGCALAFATTETTYAHLHNASVEDVAVLIKKTIAGVKEKYIRRSLSTLENFRLQDGIDATEHIHLRHPHNGMIVTNLSRLPIRDLDFGTGAPDNFLSYAEVARSAAILPAHNGVELYVVHPTD